jgi:predicted AlkP superfamily phosphohydrolase/phosphomutase
MTHLDWSPFLKEHFAREGLLEYVLDLTHDDPSNLTIKWENTKCHPLEPCHVHVFINMKGRDPQGIVEPEDYEKVQEEIIKALQNMRNPETGDLVVSLAIKKQEAGTLGIQEGPGYDRIGDVLFSWKPGYMSHPFIYRSEIQYRDGTKRIIANPELFEAAQLGRTFTGVHLALPSIPSMHACMLLSGPGVKEYERKFPAKIIDVTPTLCQILGIPVPKDAEGSVLYDVLENIQ